jgi:hypothetical protein
MPSSIVFLEQCQSSWEFTSASQCQPIYSPLESTLEGTKFDVQAVSPASNKGVSHISLNTNAPDCFYTEMGDFFSGY